MQARTKRVQQKSGFSFAFLIMEREAFCRFSHHFDDFVLGYQNAPQMKSSRMSLYITLRSFFLKE